LICAPGHDWKPLQIAPRLESMAPARVRATKP
jgi:hypothetical protein